MRTPSVVGASAIYNAKRVALSSRSLRREGSGATWDGCKEGPFEPSADGGIGAEEAVRVDVRCCSRPSAPP